MEVVKIYSMIYDSPKYGNNGYGEYLGEFKKLNSLEKMVGWMILLVLILKQKSYV